MTQNNKDAKQVSSGSELHRLGTTSEKVPPTSPPATLLMEEDNGPANDRNEWAGSLWAIPMSQTTKTGRSERTG